MEVIVLNDLQYAEPADGPWRLYVFQEDGFHSGGKWFYRESIIKYPDEEISKEEAYQSAVAAIHLAREVRVVDGGDKIVFHSKDGVVVYGETFWEKIGFDLRKIAQSADRIDLAKQGLSRDGLCIECHQPALPRCYSEAGRREYSISGLCERCFDSTFS